jgi:hypothetical protein
MDHLQQFFPNCFHATTSPSARQKFESTRNTEIYSKQLIVIRNTLTIARYISREARIHFATTEFRVENTDSGFRVGHQRKSEPRKRYGGRPDLCTELFPGENRFFTLKNPTFFFLQDLGGRSTKGGFKFK